MDVGRGPDPLAAGRDRRSGSSVKARGRQATPEKLQEIADANGGTRAAATPGYDASRRLRRGQAPRRRIPGHLAGVRVLLLPRDRGSRAQADSGPRPRRYVPGTDFRTMTYSGSGNVTAPVQAVDLVLPPTPDAELHLAAARRATSPGSPGQHRADPARHLHLPGQGGTRQAAGASGVIIFNEGQAGQGTDDRRALLGGSVNTSTWHPGRRHHLRGRRGAGRAPGRRRRSASTPRRHRDRKTRNVIAESRCGRPGQGRHARRPPGQRHRRAPASTTTAPAPRASWRRR